MSGAIADRALDALIAELRPPPVPLGLADRVAAAALALPQGAPVPPAAPRHIRRGLHRPLLIGAAALGLAFASAVAASLAGLDLPRPVAAVIEKLPLVGKAEPEAPPPARPTPRPAAQRAAPPPPVAAPVAPPPVEAPPVLPPHQERVVRRIEQAREIVAERRAAGLPTPRADRFERMLERRRAAGLPTPRADRIERLLEQRRAARPEATPPRALPLPALPPQPSPPRAEPAPASPAPDQPRPASTAPQRDAVGAEQRRAWFRHQQLLRLERRATIRRMQGRPTLARPGPRR